MKKKTLKLSLETLRRLDLAAATGGVHNPSIGPMCELETQQSCGVVGCPFPPRKPLPRSLGASCGIICF
jgi:hypothetical protein